MKIIAVLDSLFFISTIIYIFINWKIAILLFVIGSIVHVIPRGPDFLLGLITGYLILGGGIILFFNWRIGIGLILAGFLTTKFRLWTRRVNYEHYQRTENQENNQE